MPEKSKTQYLKSSSKALGYVLTINLHQDIKKKMIMKAVKKTNGLLMAVSVLFTILALCGCSERQDDSKGDGSRLSLSSLYSTDVRHKVRFNGNKKDDVADAYEMVSRKWNLDFLLAAEQRCGPDTLK